MKKKNEPAAIAPAQVSHEQQQPYGCYALFFSVVR